MLGEKLSESDGADFRRLWMMEVEASDLPGPSKAVARQYAAFAGDHPRDVYVLRKIGAKRAGISVRTWTRHRKNLEREGWLVETCPARAGRDGGSAAAAHYRLVLPGPRMEGSQSHNEGLSVDNGGLSVPERETLCRPSMEREGVSREIDERQLSVPERETLCRQREGVGREVDECQRLGRYRSDLSPGLIAAYDRGEVGPLSVMVYGFDQLDMEGLDERLRDFASARAEDGYYELIRDLLLSRSDDESVAIGIALTNLRDYPEGHEVPLPEASSVCTPVPHPANKRVGREEIANKRRAVSGHRRQEHFSDAYARG